jgi:hypothetical protein
MVDSEGEDLPFDDGKRTFDLSFQCDEHGVPYFALGVPMYFETVEDEHAIYNSCGVLIVDFKEVMEEYLANIHAEDGGEYAKSLASYLREYADKLDAVEAVP